MTNEEKTGILTDLERCRLADYNNLGAVEKKNLNFRLKKKLNVINGILKDINLLLTSLPSDALREHINTETATCSLQLTERILKSLDPFPIDVIPTTNTLFARRYNLIHFPNGKDGSVEFEYRPSIEEEQMYNAVQDHINELKRIYDVNAALDMNVYSFDEYKEKMRPKIEYLFLNGIRHACFTRPDLIPGNWSPARRIELEHEEKEEMATNVEREIDTK